MGSFIFWRSVSRKGKNREGKAKHLILSSMEISSSFHRLLQQSLPELNSNTVNTVEAQETTWVFIVCSQLTH